MAKRTHSTHKMKKTIYEILENVKILPFVKNAKKKITKGIQNGTIEICGI